MRPNALKTKIFLDSGDPLETESILQIIGFLDGQTTNPTLIAKSPAVVQALREGKKFRQEEAVDLYRGIVKTISKLIPHGSVSIETYADSTTSADEMLKEGTEMFSWIPNAHIKYPTTKAGLEAAKRSLARGMRVNMTLCFSEEQAAAVYAATRGAKRGDVLISPFVGRLDDIGENGMDLVKNIIELYRGGDGHVEVLTASVRNMEHFLCALAFRSDIITAPYKVLKEWGEKGMAIPSSEYSYELKKFVHIPYAKYNLNEDWQKFKILHPLTDKGVDQFSRDWHALIIKE